MADQDVSEMKVAELKRELKIRGLKITGIKRELAERLQSALRDNISNADDTICKVNKRVSNYKSKRGAKKAKIDGHRRALVSSLQQSPHILKLPVEILEYIFDYLDVWDLSAVGKTCKWLQQVAGGCYTQNYARLHPSLYRKGTFRVDYYFIQFFDKIKIMEQSQWRPHLPVFYKFLELKSEFHRLKKLTICGVDFNNVTVDSLKEVLMKLEYLDFSECEMEESFIEKLIAVAPNIKRFSVKYCRTGNRWMAHTYPTLEHCEVISEEVMPIAMFLKLNPNIRNFGINSTNLWENRHLIQTSEKKLNDLAIYIKTNSELLSFFQLLNELHRIGFYKRLKFKISYSIFRPKIFNQNWVEEIANLTALARLYVGRNVYFDRVALSGLLRVEDLSFPDSRYITDIETIATRLENLERIHLGISKLSHVKLIMSANLKLEIIEIDWFVDDAGKIEEDKVLNLFELNKIRAKLSNAKKITLYVEEEYVYLPTKQANQETDLDFVKLRRTNTINESNFDFYFTELYNDKSKYIHADS